MPKTLDLDRQNMILILIIHKLDQKDQHTETS